MKRIFLDTNFIVDYLVRPDYSATASMVLRNGHRRGYVFVVSFLTVANFSYINRKMPKAQRCQMINGILEAFEIADNTFHHLKDALMLDAADYEDALQYLTALSSGCEAIITRNGKDFFCSSLPVYTPDEFLKLLHGEANK